MNYEQSGTAGIDIGTTKERSGIERASLMERMTPQERETFLAHFKKREAERNQSSKD